MRIYDGDSNTSPLLENPICGDSLPPNRISSSNHLFIHFESDQSHTGTGFKLEYNATSKCPYKVLVLECGWKTKKKHSEKCDFDIRDSTKFQFACRFS